MNCIFDERRKTKNKPSILKIYVLLTFVLTPDNIFARNFVHKHLDDQLSYLVHRSRQDLCLEGSDGFHTNWIGLGSENSRFMQSIRLYIKIIKIFILIKIVEFYSTRFRVKLSSPSFEKITSLFEFLVIVCSFKSEAVFTLVLILCTRSKNPKLNSLEPSKVDKY